MDIRIVKTKNRIMEAFLILRDKMLPENIKVKDICEAAMINKTTFYKHYADSIELSNEIEESAIEKVMSAIKTKCNILTQPREYLSELMSALEAESSHLRVVFKGKQEIMSTKLADKLLGMSNNADNDTKSDLRLSFAIGGVVRVVNDFLFTNKKFDAELLTLQTISMLESIPF